MGELYNPFPKLPRNIRQIGEKDEVVKLYLEDYVNTYLKRLYPTGGQDLRVGLLLGSMEQQDGTPYLFIDGALEMEGLETDGEKVLFSEAAWKKTYQSIEENFPKRTVQGWFLCGAPGCALSPLNYWKQHSQYFSGKHQLMYLNCGLDGEEAVYVTSEDGFYRLKGHSIYYERNQMMQDYMILRKDVRRVETGANDRVIRDFRQKMGDRKLELSGKKSTIHLLGAVCSALSVVVLAGGIVMFNNYQRMKEMETTLVSALPDQVKGWDGTSNQKRVELEGGVLIEELPGNVSPALTETKPLETETIEATLAEEWQGQEGEQETAPPTAAVSPENAETTAVPETAAPETAAPEEAPQGGNATASQDYVESAAVSAGQTYVVGEGETLYGICFKLYHNLDKLQEICDLNQITDTNKLMVGQNLILP